MTTDEQGVEGGMSSGGDDALDAVQKLMDPSLKAESMGWLTFTASSSQASSSALGGASDDAINRLEEGYEAIMKTMTSVKKQCRTLTSSDASATTKEAVKSATDFIKDQMTREVDNVEQALLTPQSSLTNEKVKQVLKNAASFLAELLKISKELRALINNKQRS